jgi:hypothetical protein
MQVLIRIIADAREDSQVRLARVVDEARWPGEVLAVDLERRAAEPSVVAGDVCEFVQRE